jgi:hypothetical protein
MEAYTRFLWHLRRQRSLLCLSCYDTTPCLLWHSLSCFFYLTNRPILSPFTLKWYRDCYDIKWHNCHDWQLTENVYLLISFGDKRKLIKVYRTYNFDNNFISAIGLEFDFLHWYPQWPVTHAVRQTIPNVVWQPHNADLTRYDKVFNTNKDFLNITIMKWSAQNTLDQNKCLVLIVYHK